MRLLRCGCSDELDERRGKIGPGVAAVGAADDAAHLEPRVDDVGLRRVDDDAHDARRKAHLAVAGRFRPGELLPRVAAVLAAVDPDRRRARVHDVRPRRMERERPHHRAAIGKAEALPARAAVGRAVGTVLRARVDHARLARMHGERARLDVLRQTGGERLPFAVAGLAAEEPAGGALAGAGYPVSGAREDVASCRCSVIGRSSAVALIPRPVTLITPAPRRPPARRYWRRRSPWRGACRAPSAGRRSRCRGASCSGCPT